MRIDNQNIFFASDYHVGHANIIRFDKRPFTDVNEMHEVMIERWNEVVSKDSIVLYLGDLAFSKSNLSKWFVSQLNGKLRCVLGNHDRYREISKLNRFESIHEYGTEISVADTDVKGGYQHIILCHYPILSWNRAHHGSWHLHGHCHQNLTKDEQVAFYYNRKVIDVGCNGWDYTPLSYKQVKEIMATKQVSKVENHD